MSGHIAWPADWSSANSPCGGDRAGSTDGATTSSPMCRKMRSITGGSSTNAMIRMGSPQRGHSSGRHSYLNIGGVGSPTLTLLPGTVMKFQVDAGINVGTNGALVAEQVVFTSYLDDVGGDTAGTTATPGPANWRKILYME